MLIFDKNTVLINNEPSNPYFKRVLTFYELWLSGCQQFAVTTSGSTGTPKIITFSRAQLIASAKLTGDTFGLNSQTMAFCCLNIDTIAGMMLLVRGFVLGYKTVVVEPQGYYNLAAIQLQLNKFHIHTSLNFFAFVPLQLQQVLDNTNNLELLNKANLVLIGGAAISNTLLEKIQKIKPPVYATYGMTETLTHIARKRLNGGNTNDYFETLADVSISVDERNCLKIKSKVIENNTIITNDLVEIINSSHFKLLGRIDNIINSGGIKIQLEKIENNIATILEKVQRQPRYFCYGVPDEVLGQKLILVMEGLDSTKIKLEDFQEILGKFERPKAIYFVEKFIETSSGKIDKIKTIHEFSKH